MLERFLLRHSLSGGQPITGTAEPTPGGLRSAAGGRTLAKGLYRIHTEGSAAALLAQIDVAFPEAPPHTAPYGYDWLGRQFCAERDDANAPSLMFEPGTGEVLEIPVPFEAIHDEEMVDFDNEALASDFFAAYLSAGGRPPSLTQCVGYGKPLFLGGRDDLSNLEVVDIDVYWHLTAQLILRARGLPEGTRITSITSD